MTILRRLARPMLASVFVVGGVDTLRNPEPRVQMAEPVVPKLASALPLPDDTEQLVKINAGVQVVAGSLLAIGRFPRLAALALAGSLVPTTYAGHRFWEEEEDETKAMQRIHFLKNVSVLGGLLLAAVDTGGAPSLGWRARRAARRLHEVSSAAIDAIPVG
ncbi:MAG: DoxX family protein [Actinobacteria bacterium]|nr:DoxX family protein [Actinomycetota bacterium]